MKCQRCNENQATTHIQKIINGKKTEYYLCPKCAKEMGINEFSFSFGNDFDDIFYPLFGSASKSAFPAAEKTCSSCNMTLSEFFKSGRLGCGNCYESFKDALKRPLKQIHGKTEHVGKIPRHKGEKISRDTKIRHLEAELDRAVLNQEFELAAQLRDEIKALREGGKQ